MSFVQIWEHPSAAIEMRFCSADGVRNASIQIFFGFFRWNRSEGRITSRQKFSGSKVRYFQRHEKSLRVFRPIRVRRLPDGVRYTPKPRMSFEYPLFELWIRNGREQRCEILVEQFAGQCRENVIDRVVTGCSVKRKDFLEVDFRLLAAQEKAPIQQMSEVDAFRPEMPGHVAQQIECVEHRGWGVIARRR